MPQFKIDEICPKGSLYPIIVSFQNVYVTDKFKSHDCLLLENEKTGKKNIITELCDTIYTGEEENEDLGKTLILVRNKITGKGRLIEVGKIELKPVIKTEAVDTDYLELSRKFGSKKHKQILEQHEKLNINVQSESEQMENVTDTLTEDQLDISSYNKMGSNEFFIPAINREATKLEEVCNIDTILTPEQFEKIYSEIEGTEYTSNLIPLLKSIATKTLSQKHTVLLVYANTLLQLYRTCMKEISKKNFTACQYSVTLNDFVMKNFLTNINGKRGRTLQYRVKSLCHALVFILLINNYMFNFDDLCQQLKMSHSMVSSSVALTGATLVNVGNKKVAQLKLKMNDDDQTNSIKSVSQEPVCKVCSYKAINNNDLRRHNLIHFSLYTKEKPYKCGICQRGFIRKYCLSVHIRTHTGEKPYKCDKCQSSFSLAGSLKRHIQIHTGVKAYKCDICKSSFNQSSDLKNHIQTHAGEKPYKCDICPSSFNQSYYLKKHNQIHTDEKPYKCDICRSSFNRKNELNTHIRIHTGDKPYKCDICQSSFHHSSTLKRHIRIHNDVKTYKCDICQSCFKQTSDLKIHLQIHIGEKPYKCDICQSSFNQSCDLKKHIQLHTDEKPHKCDICPSSFNRRNDLKTHIRIHTGEKPYKCDLCQSSFNHAGSLKRHIRIHNDVKPYKCDICQRFFKRSSDLKIHMEIHTGDKPYKCDICQSSFNHSRDLKKHIRIHTGDKPYKCNLGTG